jgi:hypothetical protein
LLAPYHSMVAMMMAGSCAKILALLVAFAPHSAMYCRR